MVVACHLGGRLGMEFGRRWLGRKKARRQARGEGRDAKIGGLTVDLHAARLSIIGYPQQALLILPASTFFHLVTWSAVGDFVILCLLTLPEC